MEIHLIINAKVETLMEAGVQYMLHVKIFVNDNMLENPGGGVLAAVKVDKSLFDQKRVGDELHFELV